MIKNYFLAATRHLFKNKGYTIVNALGLSVGLACFAMVSLWIKDELSFDRFHNKASRIYRVSSTFTDESGKFDQAITCIPLAPALKADLPEIEDAVRIDINDAVVQRDDKKFNEPDILGVDPSFLKIFSFQLLKGNASTALNEPYTILISRSMAKKYFGDKDPVGESLKIYQYDPDGQGAEFKITGVIEDCPLNAHFHYNFLFSFKTIESVDPKGFGYDGWFNNSYYTYILLHPEANADQLSKKLDAFLEKYIGNDMKKYKIRWSYFLQPLTRIHLESHLRYEIEPAGNTTYVIVFGSIATIALLLACINYINLSTAFSSSRFKEVGVRKVLGAVGNQLVRQYLTESWIVAILSLLLAFVWMELTRPLFEGLTGRAVTNLYTFETIGSVFIITSVVGILAGIYPAIVLSSFRPVNALKGKSQSSISGAWLRKALVVFQYTVTMILIAGIFVIQLQMKFIRERDLGFNKENLYILNVNGSAEVHAGFDAFANDLMANPIITGVARSNAFIAGGLGNRTATFTDVTGKKINGTIYTNGIDHEYISTYGMKLIAGRNFKEGNADSAALIINEMTTKVYGYKTPQDAIGSEVLFGDTKMEIIGVVKDFNSNSLHNTIEPTCLYLFREGFSRIAVRLNHDTEQGTTLVNTLWKKHFPNSIADFSFASERLQKAYIAEERFSRIFFLFSFISLSIACLGLFSLVSYTVETRFKEIGIRKILGASTWRIVEMVSQEFLVLVAIAAAIGIPISYYCMNQWLMDFAYRVKLQPFAFIIAAGIVLIIACLTVGLRVLKAALLNPVDSLRSE
ncbi:MAG TPA: ABC transporter permease [Ohtaekwangia sp.]|uniref:ABC transporter permease n=1 Tax=Ohtaekwangia sp. TaxID=2066019 RepID=UPI002F924878